MKLYGIATPSHSVLKDKWFLKTLKDDYEVVIVPFDLVRGGNFKDANFLRAVRAKVDLILRAIQENWNQIFIFSDVDIQFFKPTKRIVLDLMDGKDMVIQRDSPKGMMCTGFFACRGNEKTLAIWTDVREFMRLNLNEGDQEAFNAILIDKARGISKWQLKLAKWIKRCPLARRTGINNRLRRWSMPPCNNAYKLKIGFLPETFLGGGTLTGRHWDRGRYLRVPQNVVIHHANWTIGLGNKSPNWSMSEAW